MMIFAVVVLAAVCGLQAVAIVILARRRPGAARAQVPFNGEDWPEETTGVRQLKGAIERMKGAA